MPKPIRLRKIPEHVETAELPEAMAVWSDLVRRAQGYGATTSTSRMSSTGSPLRILCPATATPAVPVLFAEHAAGE